MRFLFLTWTEVILKQEFMTLAYKKNPDLHPKTQPKANYQPKLKTLCNFLSAKNTNMQAINSLPTPDFNQPKTRNLSHIETRPESTRTQKCKQITKEKSFDL